MSMRNDSIDESLFLVAWLGHPSLDGKGDLTSGARDESRAERAVLGEILAHQRAEAHCVAPATGWRGRLRIGAGGRLADAIRIPRTVIANFDAGISAATSSAS